MISLTPVLNVELHWHVPKLTLIAGDERDKQS